MAESFAFGVERCWAAWGTPGSWRNFSLVWETLLFGAEGSLD